MNFRDCHLRGALWRSLGEATNRKGWPVLSRRRRRQSPIAAVTSAVDGTKYGNTGGIEVEGLLSSQAPPAIPGVPKKEKAFHSLRSLQSLFFHNAFESELSTQ